MEPREHERESKKVAQLIVYVAGELGLTPSPVIVKAANDYYGNESKVHEFTEALCNLCSNMPGKASDKIIYDGRSKNARRLAGWWDAHQEADKAKAAAASAKKRTDSAKASALAKLTAAERKALGLT